MFTIIILSIILLLLIAIIFAGFYIRAKIRNFTMEYFGTPNLKEAINKSEIEYSEEKKSISSMEPMYKSYIEKDFPGININELRSMADSGITSYFNAIEKKDVDVFNYDSYIVKDRIINILENAKERTLDYDGLKIHRTAIHKYEKKHGVATITFQSAIEYYLTNDDVKHKKIQTRFNTELIYIIDASQVNDTKAKSLGLNCPNCGAPIKSLGEKHCDYCGTGIKELVKRSWVVNNIYEK